MLHQASEPKLEPGDLVGEVLGGRYRLDALIGKGAMGAVYRATQVSLDKRCAIKVLLPTLSLDPQFGARFRQEARIAAAIRHPGIVEVFDDGVENGLAYYVMELLEGMTLAELLRRQIFSVEKAVAIVADAAKAVGAVHDKGVVHRDLKPANLFLARDAAGETLVKVLDFGVSKALDPALGGGAKRTAFGWVCGTPKYMSPEQAAGLSVDGRSDQYSLAVVLYELLTGKVPFDDADPAAVIQAQLYRRPPSLQERRPGLTVSPTLEAALFRALEKSPGARFGSMLDFAQALCSSLDDVPRRPSPVPPAPQLPLKPPPHPASAPVSPSRNPARQLAPLPRVAPIPPAPAREPASERRIFIAAGAGIGLLLLIAVALLVVASLVGPPP